VTPVRFAPEVAGELAGAVLWYEARQEGLGADLLTEIDATLPLLSEPRSFPQNPHKLHNGSKPAEKCVPHFSS
jgi:hypothetical protein